MKRLRKVKILATLGPASAEEATIQKLHEAGADLFRINMSHTSHEAMRDLIGRIRNVEGRIGRPIGILADLQGPKLRVGKFKDGKVDLEIGQTFTLDDDEAPGDSKRVNLPHREILESVKAGDRLLIDDGRLQLKAEKCDGHSIVTTVVAGTAISDRKGVSLPDTTLTSGALTEKDRRDLDAVLHTGQVDWIALSFIQRPEDLAEVRKVVRGRAGLMSKIEKPQAVERIDEIIELSDALMVARGDLGVEMPIEAVPGIQKSLTRACRAAGKPVVVATQMLESMVSAPVPTRAEVSDVATAVFEGADAVMLSAEFGGGAISGRGGVDDGVDRPQGRARSEFPEHHLRPASATGPDRCRRDLAGGAPDRGDAEPQGDRLLHVVGHYRAARRARATADADPGAVAGHRDGAAALRRVGPALRGDRRRKGPRRHG